MIERKVTAAPTDTYVEPSFSKTREIQRRQAETQRFFKNMGAMAHQDQQFQREQELEDYRHLTKLQTRSVNGRLATLQQTLQDDAYRDASMEKLKGTPEYKSVVESLSLVKDEKTKEQLSANLESTLGNIHDTHTHAKAQETMEAISFDAFMHEKDDSKIFDVVDESAATIGYAAAYSVAADEAISSGNLNRVNLLLEQNDARMDVADKSKLLRAKTRIEAVNAKSSAKFDAEYGYAMQRYESTKDIKWLYKAQEFLLADGKDDKGKYGTLLGKIEDAEVREVKMEQAVLDVFNGATDLEVASKYDLPSSDIKILRDQAYNEAFQELQQGKPASLARLLKTAPEDVSSQLNASISKTMGQLSAIAPEDIAQMQDNDPRLANVGLLRQIGDLANDVVLKQALGGEYDDYIAFKLDAQAGGNKFALLQMKERQNADAIKMSASRHPRWSYTRNDVLKAALSDVPEAHRDALKPYLHMKLDNLAKRYSPTKSKEMLNHWIGLNKTFEYNGDTIMFAQGFLENREALVNKGYEIGEEELWEKYRGYALKKMQEKHPDIEEISLIPSPSRPDWYTVVDPNGITYFDNGFIHSSELMNTFLNDIENKTKFQAALDNVRGG